MDANHLRKVEYTNTYKNNNVIEIAQEPTKSLFGISKLEMTTKDKLL